MFPNMFRNILYSEIKHMVNFDVHIPSGFRVIQKIYFLIYPRHNDVIIITFSTSILNQKSLRRRGRITKY